MPYEQAVTIEQLLYTWARSGLTGPNCFQPVASTDRLRQDSRLKDQVLRLCRYDMPAGADPESAPVSYGWVDSGPLRFVFRRAAVAGLDAFGRSGNFVAHILVGAANELPTDEILAAWESPAWWRGETVDTDHRRLSPAHLASFPSAVRPSAPAPEITMALMIWLLRRPGRLTLARPPEEIMAASLQAALTLPSLSEGASLSTYEGPGSPIRPLIAGGWRSGADATDVLSLEQLASTRPVAAALIDGDTRIARTLRRLWLRSPVGEQHREEFLSAAQIIVATASDADIPRETFVGLLADEATAVDLLDYPKARIHLARLLVSGDSQMASAVGRLTAAVDDQVWAALGERVACLLSWDDAKRLDEQLRFLTGLDRHIDAAVTAAAVDRLVTDPADCRHWPLQLIAAVATNRIAHTLGPKVEDELIAAASRRVAESRRGATPPSWWATVVARAVSDEVLPPWKAGQLLVADLALVAPFVDAAPASVAADTLRTVSPDAQAKLLGQATRPAHRGDFVALLHSLSSSLGAPELLGLAMGQRTALGARSVESWADLVGTTVERWMRYVISLANKPHALAELAYICRYERSGDIPSWRHLLSSLSVRRPEPHAIAGYVRPFESGTMCTAFGFALDVCVAKARLPIDITETASELAAGESLPVLSHALLVAAMRAALVERNARPGGLVLFYIAQRVDSRQLPRRRVSGALQDETLQAKSQLLVQRLRVLGSGAHHVLNAAATSVDRPGRSWLGSLGISPHET